MPGDEGELEDGELPSPGRAWDAGRVSKGGARKERATKAAAAIAAAATAAQSDNGIGGGGSAATATAATATEVEARSAMPAAAAVEDAPGPAPAPPPAPSPAPAPGTDRDRDKERERERPTSRAATSTPTLKREDGSKVAVRERERDRERERERGTPLWGPHGAGKDSSRGGGGSKGEGRDKEWLLAELERLTRAATFQDVRSNWDEVCANLKVAIKRLDKLQAKVKRRKGEDLEAYPEVHEFASRISSGLRHVMVLCGTSHGRTHSLEAARLLMRTAMNYRHDVFSKAQKRELEAALRESKDFQYLVRERERERPKASSSSNSKAAAAQGKVIDPNVEVQPALPAASPHSPTTPPSPASESNHVRTKDTTPLASPATMPEGEAAAAAAAANGRWPSPRGIPSRTAGSKGKPPQQRHTAPDSSGEEAVGVHDTKGEGLAHKAAASTYLGTQAPLPKGGIKREWQQEERDEPWAEADAKRIKAEDPLRSPLGGSSGARVQVVEPLQHSPVTSVEEESGGGGHAASQREDGWDRLHLDASATSQALLRPSSAQGSEYSGPSYPHHPHSPHSPPLLGVEGRLAGEQVLHDTKEGLLQQRRLLLVLDLDHTLVNSVTFSETDGATVALLEERLRAEAKQGGGEAQQQRELHRFSRLHMWTKLRPGVRTFLHAMHQLFELWIHTNGNRTYAAGMVELLDPRGEYFGSRIISQEVPTQDEAAWRNAKHLMQVVRRIGEQLCDGTSHWPHGIWHQ